MHGCVKIPHIIKKNSAPHNNSVTHLPLMKPTSTLIVLQPSFTHETPPTITTTLRSSSARLICVFLVWFRASRIIKHLQHNQRSHVQNGGGGEDVLRGAAGSWSRFYARDMFLLQTTLPVTMTTNRIFPSHTSPKCFSTQKKPSSPPLSSPTPPGVTTRFSAPSILWSLGNTLQLISCRWVERDWSHD